MKSRRYLQNAFVGSIAVLFGTTRFTPEADRNGPVLEAALSAVGATSAVADTASSFIPVERPLRLQVALGSFHNAVRPLSHPRALEDAFKSYFAFKAAHPERVKKPLLYFVDYGLPSSQPRGYVFDMEKLKIVDGPFTVAHGRGSAPRSSAIPVRFSNAPNSYATSLGLYVAAETYRFGGKSGGRRYSSVGLKLDGVSEGFNDNARVRKVVAHGAPYVTANRAGRSEGCPAMEEERARRLLPALANGGMVFLFAPEEQWMERDPWVTASLAE